MSEKLMLVTTDTMRKVAQFIELATPIVKQAAEQEQRLAAAIPQVVDGLVENGHLSPHMKEAKAKEFADNPSSMADALQKIASTANVHTPVGAPAGETKEATQTANEVFVDRLLGGSQS